MDSKVRDKLSLLQFLDSPRNMVVSTFLKPSFNANDYTPMRETFLFLIIYLVS